MSEDALKIQFEFPRIELSRHKQEVFEGICRRCMLRDAERSTEMTIDYQGDEAEYFHEFINIGQSDITQLLERFTSCGTRNIRASAYSDSSGETVHYALDDGKLHEFESEGAIERFKVDRAGQRNKLKIEYGRPESSNTLLVRLYVRAKAARLELSRLFEDAIGISSSAVDDWVSRFKELAKAERHDVSWGRFKWKNNDQWIDVFPPELIVDLRSVVTERSYIYLGFDLEGKSNQADRQPAPPKKTLDSMLRLPQPIEDFSYFVFYNLAGVSKVWIKRRIDAKFSYEWYLYYPGMGDESYFIDRPISADADWPK